MKRNFLHALRYASKVFETQVLEYVNKKYDEDFTIAATTADHWWVKNKDGIVFGVSGGQDTFTDAYYNVLIQKEYENFLNQVISKVFSTFIICLKLDRETACPDGLIKNVPITEIHKHIKPGGLSLVAHIMVIVLESDYKTDGFVQILNALSEVKLMAWVKLYIVEDAAFSSWTCDMAKGRMPYMAGYTDWDYNLHILPPFKPPSTCSLLDDAQLERLCSLVYLDGILLHSDEGRVGEIVKYIITFDLNGTLPCRMSKVEWLNVLYDIRDDADLSRLRVIKIENVTETQADGTMPGHRVIAFIDDAGNGYAIFRGTGSDDEWYDNALGMTEVSTPQQAAAARFIMALKQIPQVEKIVAAGHSKGGNKAQYAAITTGMVDYCLSIDGQGFSPAFINAYRFEIDKRKSIINLIAERRDFVHCLGLYAKVPTNHFSGRRGGQPIPYFHCPDALRDANGHIGPFAYKAPISDMLNMLVVYFLMEPKYAHRRYETAADLMGLMMTDKRVPAEETEKALANLTVVFMDLMRHNASFRQCIKDVLTYESEVVLTCANDIRYKLKLLWNVVDNY